MGMCNDINQAKQAAPDRPGEAEDLARSRTDSGHLGARFSCTRESRCCISPVFTGVFLLWREYLRVGRAIMTLGRLRAARVHLGWRVTRSRGDCRQFVVRCSKMR